MSSDFLDKKQKNLHPAVVFNQNSFKPGKTQLTQPGVIKAGKCWECLIELHVDDMDVYMVDFRQVIHDTYPGTMWGSPVASRIKPPIN